MQVTVIIPGARRRGSLIVIGIVIADKAADTTNSPRCSRSSGYMVSSGLPWLISQSSFLERRCNEELADRCDNTWKWLSRFSRGEARSFWIVVSSITSAESRAPPRVAYHRPGGEQCAAKVVLARAAKGRF